MITIRLFGPTTVTTDNGTLDGSALGGVKPRQILEILALSAGTPVPKDRLADLLWDGQPPRCYLGTLESYVCVLRRSLGLRRGRNSGINTVAHGYLLDPEVISVDLVSFRSLVRSVTSRGPAPAGLDDATALARLETAVDMAAGDLLASEVYATWAIRERETARQELVDAAGRAAVHALEQQRPELALRLARLVLGRDRFAEDAWRVEMKAFCDLGRRAEALRAYCELRDLLAEELGTDPLPETTELYLETLRLDRHAGEALGRGGHDEVRMLLGLLRQAVGSIPGQRVPSSDRALALVAADLAAAS